MVDINLQTTANDIATFCPIIEAYLQSVPEDGWGKRTGQRDKDWTLQETLSHLVSIARLFNLATTSTLDGKSQVDDEHMTMTRREDLRDWNIKEIARYSNTSPNDLITALIKELKTAEHLANTITSEQAQMPIFIPVYNRPASIQNWLDWHLSHAGIIHASQITRPMNHAPLWEQYTADFSQRQIDRFLRHFSWAYWHEHGGDNPVVFNFHIGGEAEGIWHLVAASDGGYTGQGEKPNADFNLYFTSADIFFGIFTVHLSIQDVLKAKTFRADGDIRKAFEVLSLFSASPPKTHQS